MKVPVRQLERHLNDRLAPVYLIAGDEPLLVDEALEQTRAAARRRGFDSRELYIADRGFRWSDLTSDADNLSLFSNRKIIELRMATPRPGDEGSRSISALSEKRDPDRLLIVIVGEKLDAAATRASWVKSIDEHGVLVNVWPIDRTELPRWIQQRAQAAGLTFTTPAAQLLAERVEGNLLAADQEIKRLALVGPGREIDEAEVLESVANNARYDVFRLVDAVSAGDAERAIRVFWGVRAEGLAPALVSWALSREISLLASLQFAVAHGENLDGALTRLHVWGRRQALVKKAVARFRGRDFAALVSQAAAVDGMIKGVTQGQPWEALTGLVIALLRPVAKH
ncbi:MAG TPA: DNA polymerase III subunit delta [Gammaproteobacteria bacterium]|nr:DNA polymerase III subunit delta [Gammaproteobacteria bacterium]